MPQIIVMEAYVSTSFTDMHKMDLLCTSFFKVVMYLTFLVTLYLCKSVPLVLLVFYAQLS